MKTVRPIRSTKIKTKLSKKKGGEKMTKQANEAVFSGVERVYCSEINHEPRPGLEALRIEDFVRVRMLREAAQMALIGCVFFT